MSLFASSFGKRLAPISILLVGLGLSGSLFAGTIQVAAGDSVQDAIASAQPGDTVRLAAGSYSGNLVIDKSLTLEGPQDRSAIILGERTGRSVWVTAADVTIRNLTVKNSGLSLSEMDAGIFLDKTAHKALIEHNNVLDNLVGVHVWGPQEAVVRGNHIVGNTELRVAERGNGVTLWNSPGTQIVGNDISQGRDGVFVNTSSKNIFKGNYFHDLRYALHYMYANDSEVIDNVSKDNDIAYAIMFSHRLVIKDNISIASRDQGLMLNYANDSLITGNVVVGGEKCVFLYNANKNQFTGNYFQDCDMGIHFTAGSEGNNITGNAFVNNQNQVKYVGTRSLDWSHDGRGNYWSDNTAFDLDGDGIADTAYRPNDIIDQVLWRAPAARVLLNSPAISVVRWAQSQFPAILPGGVVDSAPLMNSPEPMALTKFKESL